MPALDPFGSDRCFAAWAGPFAADEAKQPQDTHANQ